MFLDAHNGVVTSHQVFWFEFNLFLMELDFVLPKTPPVKM